MVTDEQVRSYYHKTMAVIQSCKTGDQLYSAVRMKQNFLKMTGNMHLTANLHYMEGIMYTIITGKSMPERYEKRRN